MTNRSSCRASGRLWAVTAYFNPMNRASRLRNYRAFRSSLNVPLITVELALGNDYELSPDDADELVQIRGGDILWQKERLLNIAIAHTPESCNAIAWIDCDIVFQSDEWAHLAEQALTEHKIIQPFRVMRQGWLLDGCPTALPQYPPRDSLVSRLEEGSVPLDIFRTQGASMQWLYSPGLVWACRRDILREHGLYDALIMGSGDKAIAAAALGRFHDAVVAFNMNPSASKHYLQWAVPFHEAVHGCVGFLDIQILHLWHGDLRKRQYASRYQGFSDFDPYADITIDAHGAWRWSSSKPHIHRALHDFFAQRDEDTWPPQLDHRVSDAADHLAGQTTRQP